MLYRSILFAVLYAIFVVPLYGAQIANVKYVQDTIWDIWSDYWADAVVNYASGEDSRAVNMHWLLDAVDVANQKITGAQTSYADTEYATTQVADTISVIQATRTLIKPNTIYVTTADSGTTKFVINAYGPFMVTCGDGAVWCSKDSVCDNAVGYFYAGQTIECTNVSGVPLVVTGKATGYDVDSTAAAIAFKYQDIREIHGSFAGMFPIVDGVQPIFNEAFSWCQNLEYVSETLFANLYGVKNLRDGTFTNAFQIAYMLKETVKLFDKYLYEIWPDATVAQVGGMYTPTVLGLVMGIKDRDSIPVNWR